MLVRDLQLHSLSREGLRQTGIEIAIVSGWTGTSETGRGRDGLQRERVGGKAEEAGGDDDDGYRL